MATLNFKGKSFVQNHHLSVKYHQLIPKKEKSLTDKVSLNDNLIIHGDNLIALKALLPTYAGKVKCIYIDPPYNTGNEKWIYNDNVNSPMMQEWLGKVVDKEDFTRHDKWLCMMMPRLKLLRELLRDDGVIFVSIDDNEVHHLRMLMDEVFGEGNFLSDIAWKKRSGAGQDAEYFSPVYDHIICYRKSKEFILQDEMSSQDVSSFKYDEVSCQYYQLVQLEKWGRHSRREDRPNLCYPIIAPDKTEIWPRNGEGNWRWGKSRVQKALQEGVIIFEKKENGWKVYQKKVVTDVKRKRPETFWIDKGFNPDGSKILRELFNGISPFETPKPVELIKFILTISTDKDSIILDSFAGSGTTAHAVSDLNNEDGGNRKFILVECEDYADKITAERVRRVIKGYKKGHPELVSGSKSEMPKQVRHDKEGGLGGTFSYFELGDPIEMESILEGKKLPDYMELARYIFYTATGEEFNPSKVKQSKNFIGETKDYEVYLFYEPDIEKLKKLALTLDTAKKLGPFTRKKRLVFAPSKYLDLNDADLIEKHGLKGIEYCQLPFEIYKMRG